MIERRIHRTASARKLPARVRTAIRLAGLGIAGARPGDAGSGEWADVLGLVTGALVVGLAFARMQFVRRRIDSGNSETDVAITVGVLPVFLVIAFFGLLRAFTLRLIP